jgi:nucleolar protein 56
MILFTTWFGTFLYEDEGILKSALFPKDAKEIAKRLDAITSGKILKEEKKLVSGQERFLVLDERLKKLGGELIEEEMPPIEPEDFDFSSDMLHDAMMILARQKAEPEVSKDDSISQAINALDDLQQSTNLLSERLHEWYGMHFPSQQRAVKEEEFIEIVIKQDESIKEELKEDFKPIKELARTLLEMHDRKRELEHYISDEMGHTATNLTYLVGPIIGARLISKAGGLSKLSKLPSGTIQMLGAEKALFRHLKDGAKPPKHGVIFQHPFVHRAPYWQRGKIARAFASKIAIAAKMDEHSDRFLGVQLKKDLVERIEDIKEKYPKPKKKTKRK